MKFITVHCEPSIPWHSAFALKMRTGLLALGFDPLISHSRERQTDIAILLGTSTWRDIEKTGKYLLVDRCSFGDTNKYVSLVWNGHGRRGDHKLPGHVVNFPPGDRWDLHGVPLKPFLSQPERRGRRHVICGQCESYSPKWPRIEDWYRRAIDERSGLGDAYTHFRPHPAGDNPTHLPTLKTWDDVWFVGTLNSSVGVQALIDGCLPYADDAGSMIYDWNSDIGGPMSLDDRRLNMLRVIAWTQWHHEEIQQGEPIRHLFEDI